MYRFNIAKAAKFIYPDIFFPSDEEKVLYLTFDDGPNMNTTPQLLAILEKFDVKATFFCLGKNVENNEDLFSLIKNSHAIGNHGYLHLDGFKTPKKTYVDNVKNSEDIIESNFFRPPYGRIRPAQYKLLKQKYKIVLWTDMPGDFDVNVSKELLLERLISAIKPAAVIVLHDNLKSIEKLAYALPLFLEDALNQGFTFKILE